MNIPPAFVENVQLNEDLVPFMGHDSVSVMLPSHWRASADGEDVALTEL